MAWVVSAETFNASDERLVLSSTLSSSTLSAFATLPRALRVSPSRSTLFSSMLFRSILIVGLLQSRATALSAVPEKTLGQSSLSHLRGNQGFHRNGSFP